MVYHPEQELTGWCHPAMSFLLWGSVPICVNLCVLVLHHVWSSFEPTLDDFCSLLTSAPKLECLHLLHLDCKKFEVCCRPRPRLAHLTPLTSFPVTEDSFRLVSALDMPSFTKHSSRHVQWAFFCVSRQEISSGSTAASDHGVSRCHGWQYWLLRCRIYALWMVKHQSRSSPKLFTEWQRLDAICVRDYLA